MTIEEYNKLKNGTYQEAVKYFLTKYGPVPFKYPSDKNHEGIGKGLFVHHIKEDKIASLCVRENIKMYPEYQQPEQLVYVDYLEHVLLHLLIGKETAAITNLGLHGLERFLLPALRNYFNFGIENYRHEYYEKIENQLDLYKIMFSEYNILIEKIDTVLDTNIVLYENMYEMLERENKCLVVLGTGLGKTSTALQYLRDKNYKALVLGPNNTIKGERSTEDKKGNGWLEYSEVEAKTYSWFADNYNTEDYSKYDLVILDEAHHAGFDEDKQKGALLWGKAIKYLFDNNIKVLGLTATPIRSDGIDIGETVFNNCVCEGYTIEEAIELGIIYPFSFITSIYSTEGIENELKAILKKVDLSQPETRKLVGEVEVALQNIPQVYNTIHDILSETKTRRKGIIFVNSIDVIPEAADILKKAFPEAVCKSLHSKLTADEIKSTRDWFIEESETVQDLDKDKYLLAVDMISEGAHYKGVNTLIMFRQTESYLVYSQQLGRAITLIRENSENPNTVVFDLVNNIENVQYNSRKVKDKKKYKKPDSDMIKALKSTTAYKSHQIIVDNLCEDFVKKMKQLKEQSGNFLWREHPEIDEFLKQNYKQKGSDFCVDYINNLMGFKAVTKDDVHARAAFLGITDEKTIWETTELKMLNTMKDSKVFVEGNLKIKNKLIEELSSKINKTIKQIKYKLSELGISIQDSINKKSDLSEEQINYILAHRDLGRNKVAKEVNTSPYIVSEIWKEYNTQKLVSNLEQLTNEDKNFIAQYSETMSKEELISHLSVKITVPELCRYLRKNGLKGRGRNITLTEKEKQKHSIATRKHKTHIFTKEEVTNIVNKLLSGVSISKLVKELHLDRNTIKKAIIENGYNYEECLVNSNQNKKKSKIV